MIVMTNGCFDIPHLGHCRLLARCRELAGDGRVIVALDSDANVRRLKGSLRPINSWEHRREVLLAMRDVDQVIGFDDDGELLRLIASLRPDVLLKGPPAKPINEAKRALLAQWGGRIERMDIKDDSTSAMLERWHV